MAHWVATTNGTVSGPFTEKAAKTEHARLLGLMKWSGAADIRIVEADDVEAVREYMRQPWI